MPLGLEGDAHHVMLNIKWLERFHLAGDGKCLANEMMKMRMTGDEEHAGIFGLFFLCRRSVFQVHGVLYVELLLPVRE